MISGLSLTVACHNIWYGLFLLLGFRLLNGYNGKCIRFTWLRLVICCLECRRLSGSVMNSNRLLLLLCSIIEKFPYPHYFLFPPTFIIIISFEYNSWHWIFPSSTANNFQATCHYWWVWTATIGSYLFNTIKLPDIISTEGLPIQYGISHV